jgi:hypothetical protein
MDMGAKLDHMRKTSIPEPHIRRGQSVAELRALTAPSRMPDAIKTRIFSSMQDIRLSGR